MSDRIEIVAGEVEFSPEIGEIAKALPKAQAAMGEVFKAADNPHFKTKYASLAAVVDAVVPALNAHGLAVMQPATTRDGKVRITTILLHESGQWMRSTLELQPSKTDPQGVGSAITYGRRYALQAVTGVAPEDDDGNAGSNVASQRQPKREPVPQVDWSDVAGACRAALSITATEAEAKQWLADNEARINAMPTDLADEMATAYKAHVKHLRAQAKEPGQ